MPRAGSGRPRKEKEEGRREREGKGKWVPTKFSRSTALPAAYKHIHIAWSTI
jgi:hypothetical protein